ncbi:MAG: cobyrinate a,c-diamide synthase [Lachnospiraceae bacterium]|nr:cobyrinate a,c-diamide synthase [Lachnospiraceae bacterium]
MTAVSRILIAAPKSGSGKTLVSIGLMKALADRGLRVRGVKCGPDFIDPMFHERVLGIRSRNIDGFLMSRAQMEETLIRHGADADVTVAEGVMGYYDGIGGISASCSTYETASLTRTPVLLVIDAAGSGLSTVPVIRGISTYRRDAGIAGVILNRAAESLVRPLSEIIEKETGIPVVGSLPRNPAFDIESRHLGLIMPDEVADLAERLSLLAGCVRECFDLERIIRIAAEAPPLGGEDNKESAGEALPELPPVRLAVARDEAFCFMYDGNLELLRELGAEIVFFSPVHDPKLPDGTGGLILPGGYPELFAEQLSGNAAMRKEVRAALLSGMPAMAECGGFLYLHRSLTDREGRSYPMAGALDAEAFYAGRTGRFGYITVTARDGGPSVRAHEYHAYESSDPGSDCCAVKPGSGRTWMCIHRKNGGLWGFPHLYYPSAPEAAAGFLAAAGRYQAAGSDGRRMR